MSKTCRFNNAWLSNPEWKSWLQPCQSSTAEAYCKVCRKTIMLSNMGPQAIKSHCNGKKHAANMVAHKSSTLWDHGISK